MTAPQRFDFRFAPAFRAPLALAGITPATTGVEVGGGRLAVSFGMWRLETDLGNVVDAEVDGPYRWFKVIGPHLSLADRGVTFGTNAEAGVCVSFARPVPGLAPFGRLAHPSLTVTVADLEGLRAALADSGSGVGPPG